MDHLNLANNASTVTFIPAIMQDQQFSQSDLRKDMMKKNPSQTFYLTGQKDVYEVDNITIDKAPFA